jgi:hypothetical protein
MVVSRTPLFVLFHFGGAALPGKGEPEIATLRSCDARNGENPSDYLGPAQLVVFRDHAFVRAHNSANAMDMAMSTLGWPSARLLGHDSGPAVSWMAGSGPVNGQACE